MRRTPLSTAEEIMLKSSGASAHPWRKSYYTSNQPEHSSRNRHACAQCMPSWSCQVTVTLLFGTPLQSGRARSTATYGLRGHTPFCRPIKQENRNPSLARAPAARHSEQYLDCRSLWERKPYFSSGSMVFTSQYSRNTGKQPRLSRICATIEIPR